MSDLSFPLGVAAYNPANVAISGGTIDLSDGVVGAPAYGFASELNSGLYRASAGDFRYSIGGAAACRLLASSLILPDVSALAWGSSGVTGTDVTLARDGANALGLRSGNSAMTMNHSAGSGCYLGLIAFNELLTIAAAATTDSVTTIPAGAQIVAVAVRVTTVIPTAATFTVTAATGGTTFNTAAVSTAAGSTDAGTAAGGATYTSAATKIRITPNLTPGAATGVVRICGYYRSMTVPTS